MSPLTTQITYDEWGTPYLQDLNTGQVYEIDEDAARSHRLAILEQQVQQFAQQGQPQYEDQGEEGISQEQWNWEVAGAMLEEQERLGRELSPAEQNRFASHVEKTNEFPEPSDYRPHDLDSESGRKDWMAERALADAPGPASWKTEAPTETNETGRLVQDQEGDR